MTLGIRTLTRGIWTGVKEPTAKDVVEKKSILNILVAFAVATKHYLREEYSYDYDDLRSLISHLPKYETPSSIQSLDAQEHKDKSFRLTAHDLETPSNIPIELSYYVAAYLSSVNSRGLIDVPLVTPMQNGNYVLIRNQVK
jgi:putative membrane protein